MKFYFLNVVWGDSYTDLFLKVALPSELSPGNLASFPHRDESSYTIYTTSKDAEMIRKSRAYAILSQIMSTEILLIDDINFNNSKYNIVSECQKRGIIAAGSNDCAIVFLYADQVWFDGTFKNMAKIAATGKRAILSGGLRVAEETFVPVLLKQFYSKSDHTIAISSRQLVRIALDHLHPQYKSLFWDSNEFNRSPSHLYWSVPHEGVLARCFHLFPLMVRPRRRVTSFSPTIDGSDYIARACPHPDDRYIAVDSDEMMQVTVASRLESISGVSPNKSSVIKVARWAAHGTFPHHREFVRYRIRFHFNDVSPRWEEVERYSDRVIDAVCRLLAIPSIFYDWERLVIIMRRFCVRILERLWSMVRRGI